MVPKKNGETTSMRLHSLSDGSFIEGNYHISIVPCGLGKREGANEKWRVYVITRPIIERNTKGVITTEIPLNDIGDALDTLLARNPLVANDINLKFYFKGHGKDSESISHTKREPDKKIDPSKVFGNVLGSRLTEERDTGTQAQFYSFFGEVTKGKKSNFVIEESSYEPEKNKFLDMMSLLDKSVAPVQGIMDSFLVKPMDLFTQDATSNYQYPVSYRSGRYCSSVAISKSFEKHYSQLTIDNDEASYRNILTVKNTGADYDELFDIENRQKSASIGDLIFAILNDFEMSKRFGFVHEFDLDVPSDLYNTPIDIGTLSLKFKNAVGGYESRDNCHSSAVQRLKLDETEGGEFVIQPLSKHSDRGLGLLVRLHKDKPEDSYRAIDFSSDQAILKYKIIPGDQFEARANQDPKFNTDSDAEKEEMVGIHPLCGDGLTIYAPVKDLVNDGDNHLYNKVKDDEGALPLFYEDLWDGYRMDTVRYDKNDEVPTSFKSIHHQDISYKSPFDSLKTIASENYINREQYAVDGDDKPIILHPAIYTWKGGPAVLRTPTDTKEKETNPYDSKYWETLPSQAKKSFMLYYKDRQYFRLRPVFQCGISLNEDEANELTLKLVGNKKFPYSDFHDDFNYERKRPFSPGVIVKGDSKTRYNYQKANSVSSKSEYFLTDPSDSIELWIYPEPLDRDQARYHGLLQRAWSEDRRNLSIVEGQLSKYFSDEGIRPGRGQVSYFADPDVTAISIQALALGNKWLKKSAKKNKIDAVLKKNKKPITFSNILPFKVPVLDSNSNVMGSAELPFGSDPFDMRPIRIRILGTKKESPYSVVSSSSFFNRHCYDIYLPPGENISLEIVPQTDPNKLINTSFGRMFFKEASFTTIQGQLTNREGADKEKSLDLMNHLARLPGLTTAITLDAVHVSQQPIQAPSLNRIGPMDSSNPLTSSLRVLRKRGETSVEINADIQLDSRTTESIHLSAEWETFVDEPNQHAPIKFGSPGAKTDEHNVYFGPSKELYKQIDTGKVPPIDYFSYEESFSVEDCVIYSSVEEGEVVLSNKLEMGDLKHHKARVTVVAKNRYALAHTKDIRSEEFLVSIPSVMQPPMPLLSHVATLNKKLKNGSERDYSYEQTEKERLYFHRPWNVTGQGEMVAIVFDQSWRAQNKRSVNFLTDDISAWGEDPFYRSYSKESKDNLSPKDLVAMLTPYVESRKFDDDYPVLQQLELTGDERVVIDDDKKGIDLKNTHVVCVRPTFDEEERLWYIELDTRNRSLWFRLICFRCQLNALEDFKFSKEHVTIQFYSESREKITVTSYSNLRRIILEAPILKRRENKVWFRYEIRKLTAYAGENFSKSKLNLNGEVESIKPDNFYATKTNHRYEWELSVDESDQIGIWDQLKEKYVKIINLKEG